MPKGLPKSMANARAARTQSVDLANYADLSVRTALIAQVTAAGVSDTATATQIGNALYELDVLKRALSAAGIINLPTSESSVET